MSKSPSTPGPTFKYQVALSFAGEQRSYVEAVAQELNHLGIAHFLDSENEVDLWGKDLVAYFEHVFSTDSQYVVVFVSEAYASKPWTRLELRSALERTLKERGEYVLPVRFDQTHLDGLPDTIGYLNVANMTPHELASMIANKLGWTDFAAHALSEDTTPDQASDNVDRLAARMLTYLVAPSNEVALTSTLIDEAKEIVDRIPQIADNLTVESKEDTDKFVQSTATVVAPMANALAKLSYFNADAEHIRLVTNAVERIGEACLQQERIRPSGGLALLPATIVSYAAACGACLHERMDLLALILLEARFSDHDGARMHWATQFNTLTTFGRLENLKLVPGNYISQFGGGLLVQNILEAMPFAQLASSTSRFRLAFEMTEYAVGLSCQVFKEENSYWNVPAGTLVKYFTWRSDDRERHAFLKSVVDSALRNALQKALPEKGTNGPDTQAAETAFLETLQKYGNSVL